MLYLVRKSCWILFLEFIYMPTSTIQLGRNLNSSIFYIWVSLAISFVFFNFCNVYAQQVHQPLAAENITLHDPNLKIEFVASGLDFPTTMAFLGPNDFLILEKAGLVKRVTNGIILDKPLLQVDVSVKDERGLLGIAISEKKNLDTNNGTSTKTNSISHNVFLYYVNVMRKIQVVRTEYIDTI